MPGYRINKVVLFAAFMLCGFIIFAQTSPLIQWQIALGGGYSDQPYCIQQTNDNGYIVVGRTGSNDGDVFGYHGNGDYWVVKLTPSGTIQWQKPLGGSSSDEAQYIQQTLDGGYIIAGLSESSDVDVSMNHGLNDFWIVKIDTVGNIDWQKSYGGSGEDRATCIKQTSDSGYIVCGNSTSNDGDVTGHHGATNQYDYWVIKLSSLGNIEWQKSFGGTKQDIAFSVLQTFDIGYIVVGSTLSNDGDVSGNHGGNSGTEDYWVVKLNSFGIIEWQKALGGTGYDRACDILQTNSGGYMVAGDVDSNDGDVTNNHSSDVDFWVVNLDSAGAIIWQKTYGGTISDYANSISKTNKGFIVSGTSTSNNGDVSGHHGSTASYDVWILEIDTVGTLLWQKSLGGSANEEAFSAQQDSQGGYILCGNTWSYDGDITGHHGTGLNYDYWVVKLSEPIGLNGLELENMLSVYPNPAMNKVYIEFPNSEPNCIISVYDMRGQAVQKITAHNEPKIETDVGLFDAGMYILAIKTDKGVVRKKIVVEH